jgi:hypothetical protein
MPSPAIELPAKNSMAAWKLMQLQRETHSTSSHDLDLHRNRSHVSLSFPQNIGMSYLMLSTDRNSELLISNESISLIAVVLTKESQVNLIGLWHGKD